MGNCCNGPHADALEEKTASHAHGPLPAAAEGRTADPTTPLCYCFGFTLADINSEVVQKGDSDIPARITAEVQAGRCRCETANPSGRCCLGAVRKAVKAAQDALKVATYSSDAAARFADKE